MQMQKDCPKLFCYEKFGPAANWVLPDQICHNSDELTNLVQANFSRDNQNKSLSIFCVKMHSGNVPMDEKAAHA